MTSTNFTNVALLLALALSCKACSEVDDPSHDHTHGQGTPHSHDSPVKLVPAELVPATPSSPELLRLANGVTVLENVTKASSFESSVFTHEGHFTPLLFGESMRAFTIQLEPGMFLAEHPHPTESLVFTVSGKWVLCSGGNRKVMEPGSIFHFASDAPTGWEAPFEGGAQVLIVKQKKPEENYASFTSSMRNLASQLDEEFHADRVFYFRQLEADHPALAFAKGNNPSFEALLEEWKEEGASGH